MTTQSDFERGRQQGMEQEREAYMRWFDRWITKADYRDDLCAAGWVVWQARATKAQQERALRELARSSEEIEAEPVAYRYRFPVLSKPGTFDAWSEPMSMYPSGPKSEGAEVQPLSATQPAQAQGAPGEST